MDEPDKSGEGRKKKGPLDALRSLKRLFGGRRTKDQDDGKVQRAKSTSNMLDATTSDHIEEEDVAPLAANPRSLSADNVFTESGQSGERSRLSVNPLPSGGISAKLSSVLQRGPVGIKVSRGSQEDDEGLPTSPSNTADSLEVSTDKLSSYNSTNSLESLEAEMEETEDFFKSSWSVLSVSPSQDTSAMDFSSVPVTQRVNLDSQRHKLAVKQKGKRASTAFGPKKRTTSPMPVGSMGQLPQLEEESDKPEERGLVEEIEDLIAKPSEEKGKEESPSPPESNNGIVSAVGAKPSKDEKGINKSPEKINVEIDKPKIPTVKVEPSNEESDKPKIPSVKVEPSNEESDKPKIPSVKVEPSNEESNKPKIPNVKIEPATEGVVLRKVARTSSSARSSGDKSPNRLSGDPALTDKRKSTGSTLEHSIFGERKIGKRSSVGETKDWDNLGKPATEKVADVADDNASELSKMVSKLKQNSLQEDSKSSNSKSQSAPQPAVKTASISGKTFGKTNSPSSLPEESKTKVLETSAKETSSAKEDPDVEDESEFSKMVSKFQRNPSQKKINLVPKTEEKKDTSQLREADSSLSTSPVGAKTFGKPQRSSSDENTIKFNDKTATSNASSKTVKAAPQSIDTKEMPHSDKVRSPTSKIIATPKDSAAAKPTNYGSQVLSKSPEGNAFNVHLRKTVTGSTLIGNKPVSGNSLLSDKSRSKSETDEKPLISPGKGVDKNVSVDKTSAGEKKTVAVAGSVSKSQSFKVASPSSAFKRDSPIAKDRIRSKTMPEKSQDVHLEKVTVEKPRSKSQSDSKPIVLTGQTKSTEKKAIIIEKSGPKTALSSEQPKPLSKPHSSVARSGPTKTISASEDDAPSDKPAWAAMALKKTANFNRGQENEEHELQQKTKQSSAIPRLGQVSANQ